MTSRSCPRPPYRIVVEGIQSPEKSLILLNLAQNYQLTVHPEPKQDFWKLPGGARGAFLDDTTTSFAQSSYIAATYLARDLPKTPPGIHLYDRSLLSRHFCYQPLMVLKGLLTAGEQFILDAHFRLYTEHCPQLAPDLILYIRSDPRIRWGGSPSRLHNCLFLHERFEEWLGTTVLPVQIIDTAAMDLEVLLPLVEALVLSKGLEGAQVNHPFNP